MTTTGVRVVGPAALKTLMAYGGTVLDTRDAAGLSDLPRRVAALAPQPDQLILLLVNDAASSLSAASDLQQQGYSCVVLVSPAADPAVAAPDQRPG
jgi:hypothetical protein